MQTELHQGPGRPRKEHEVTVDTLIAYGPSGVLVGGLLALVRLLITRGFRVSIKAEVPRKP